MLLYELNDECPEGKSGRVTRRACGGQGALEAEQSRPDGQNGRDKSSPDGANERDKWTGQSGPDGENGRDKSRTARIKLVDRKDMVLIGWTYAHTRARRDPAGVYARAYSSWSSVSAVPDNGAG